MRKQASPYRLCFSHIERQFLNTLKSKELEALEIKIRLLIRLIVCFSLVFGVVASVFAALIFLLLEGFHPFGFQIDPTLLKWFLGITIGEVIGAFVVYVKENG